DSLGEWLFSVVRFTRQTLITGIALLLAVALAEAWLAAPQRRWPAAVRVLAVLAGAATSTYVRHAVANYGDPAAQWKWTWAISTTLLWVLLGGVAYGLLQAARAERAAHRQLLATARQHEALQAQQLEAQLSALNAQIEPHFLFNTLANVKRLYETAPERGRDMLVSLIAYLRAALPSMRRSESTLGQELDLVRSYLTILQMRMGERLDFAIDAAPSLLAARLPPMVLPTLVENAIKHGLSPLPEGGRITISAHLREDELAVEVRDNGQGFAASGGSGVGLANTRARLAALFGGRAALELEAALPRGVVARVRLPLAEVAQ
ncbi:MAG TPA: histidine kinase, partial [Roseateles sp.]|nr:histidine kinase [Roseateles sp.]